MPTIAQANVAAGTANALDGLPFQEILEPGALITLYGSTAAAGGLMSYAIGSERFMVSANANIEIAADVVDTDRDKMLDREAVPAGKQFLAIDAQIGNFKLIIEPLP